MVGSVRHGAALLGAMVLIFGTWVGYTSYAEHQPNPAVQAAGVVQTTGNTVGKEVRFGDTSTALFGVASTNTSTGSADASYDSFTPIGGLGLMSGMMLGEVTPGGTGSGLYTILIYAIIAVFIGGLMIGRTPEYLGKKIQAREVKLAGFGALVMPVIVLVLSGIAVSTTAGRAGPLNAGPHGFSEILYALTSQGNNNGSAFGGLTGNTAFLQHLGRDRHADRPVRHNDPRSRPGRCAGGQKRGARFAGYVPHRQCDVHRPDHRRHNHYRRPHFLPRRLPGADRGTTQPRKVLAHGLDPAGSPPAGEPGEVPLMASTRCRREKRRRRTANCRRAPPSSAAPVTTPPSRLTGWPRPGACSTARSWGRRLIGSFKKLDPRIQVKNPVMFVVLVGTVVTFIESIAHPSLFDWSITAWLFLTVIFANFAEAMAEGRGKAQAETLRRMRSETEARRLRPDGTEERVPASALSKGRPGCMRGRRYHPFGRRDS